MKKIIFPFVILFFIGCKTGRKAPDVSNIPVTVHIERFDQAFFAIDTNHVEQGLLDLGRQYPYFINDFAVNILGTSSPFRYQCPGLLCFPPFYQQLYAR